MDCQSLFLIEAKLRILVGAGRKRRRCAGLGAELHIRCVCRTVQLTRDQGQTVRSGHVGAQDKRHEQQNYRQTAHSSHIHSPVCHYTMQSHLLLYGWCLSLFRRWNLPGGPETQGYNGACPENPEKYIQKARFGPVLEQFLMKNT